MNNSTVSQDFSIRSIISGIFKYKYIIIIVFIIGLIGSFTMLKFQTAEYQATVKLHIKGQTQVVSTYLGFNESNRSLTHTIMIKTNHVINRAVKALNLQNEPLDYENNFASGICFTTFAKASSNISTPSGGFMSP